MALCSKGTSCSITSRSIILLQDSSFFSPSPFFSRLWNWMYCSRHQCEADWWKTSDTIRSTERGIAGRAVQEISRRGRELETESVRGWPEWIEQQITVTGWEWDIGELIFKIIEEEESKKCQVNTNRNQNGSYLLQYMLLILLCMMNWFKLF